MILHELKTVNPYFEDVWNGLKPFDVRRNDRDYQVGDILLLIEYDPKTCNRYLFREILCEITYIMDDWRYVKEEHVIMGINVLKKMKRRVKD